jgi:hypothetical protein
MGFQSSQGRFSLSRSAISLPSTYLFLSWIFPSSSLAQLSDLPSPTAQPDPSVESSTDDHTTNNAGRHTFNFYILIVAAIVLIFCLAIFCITRRRKQKAALIRSQGQLALARDIEGWRGHFGVGRITRSSHISDREEGLDERGEAPPPYVHGSKPPSIRTIEGRRPRTTSRHTGTGDVELGDMSRHGNDPPAYEQTTLGHNVDVVDIRRPEAAVTASDRVEAVVGH